MPYINITPEPGVVRPGTVYDARGRWYETNLVRWDDGVMRPFGGWDLMEWSYDEPVSAAILHDQDVGYVDDTTDANDAGTGDVVILTATPALNDAFYFGYDFRFSEVLISLSTAATDGAITWEYWDGSAWSALSGVVDNLSATYGFDTTGTQLSVSWTLPTDWATTTVNSQGPFYYVRARVSTAGTTTALADQIWIGGGPLHVDEVVRGTHSWRNNNGVPFLALGTPDNVYALSAGRVYTVLTSVGGAADATTTAGAYDGTPGYPYGSGLYGVGDAAQEAVVEAQTYQMDNYGEDLVFTSYADGTLYYWDTSNPTVAAAGVSGAPSNNLGVVVTPERFLVALGAGGDGRKIQWADQDSHTTWTAASTNQAGDLFLPGNGTILAGLRAARETLIWTETDLFALRYVGGAFIYSAVPVGPYGAASRRAMVLAAGGAFWMGSAGFYAYDGTSTPLPSPLTDYVFSDINATQISKVWAEHRSAYSEVHWYYPSGNSTECDRFVVYNYEGGFWYIGQMPRTGGEDAGVFGYPIAVDPNGAVYQHETGESYTDYAGTAIAAYAETGPIELGQGDRVLHAQKLLPDEATLGDLDLTFKVSFAPTATESTYGPYTAANPTPVRFTGRQCRLLVDPASGGNFDWRLGTVRLDVEPGGER